MKQRKRLLMISQNFYPELGSAGNRMKNIYQLLVQEGYDVTVLTNEPSYPNRHIYEDESFWHDVFLNSDKNIHRIQAGNKKYAHSMINRLLFYLTFTFKMIWFLLRDKNKYDVVYATSPAIFIGFVGLIAKIRFRARFILEIRDLWPESLKGVGVFDHRFILGIFYRLEKLLYQKADHIVVNSTGFIGYITERANVDCSDITYLPNAARESEIPDREEKPKDFKVIYTGNVGLAQDVDFLKELSVKMNEAKIPLSIVGYGMRRNELIEFVKENQMEYVRFFTPVKRKECLAMNAEHEVGILSLNESDVFDTVLPGKLIDYMISGLPIVAAVSGNAKKIIEDHNVGYVSEKRDAGEIVQYITYLRENPEVRCRMAGNSRNVIETEFLWERNISHLTEAVEQVCDRCMPIQVAIKSNTGKVESK
ncbi:MAG: glycosyltransferase family 4 protein [Bacillus sp. (in: firmicutes)]